MGGVHDFMPGLKHHVYGIDQKTGEQKAYVQRIFDLSYIEKWKHLRSLGFSVASDILLNPMRGFMLLEDVKKDGSELYGKSLENSFYYGTRRDRPRPEIDSIFLELTCDETFGQIQRGAERVVENANTRQIQLPSDDPMELLIHPDGTWDFITLDLEKARIDRPKTHLQSEARKFENEIYKDAFIQHLRSIRNFLSTA
jgi:hypothetical protein